ncbi:glycosyltransferase [Mycolicibacterium neworleansense]|uniref:Glycosyltransferase n=1 Tax=Mycolicibacterium neworleansense TaxID=146018 RepID=A0A0H5RQS3_9MYCO|nr:glycosyltransferase [Mycolicibacterium neworleansense]
MATIAIIAIGSRGDVAPLTGVGVRLQQAGHRVIMVAYQAFANLVTGCGLEFRALDDGLTDASTGLSDLSARQAAKAMAAFLSPHGMRALGDQVSAVVRDEPVDALLLSPFAELAGHPLADALAVPAISVRLQPFSATSQYPPAVLGAWSAGPIGNRAAARIGVAVIDGVYGRTVNHFRAQLDLPKASARSLRRRRTEARLPILYGYSPAVLPRPSDWRAGVEVVGYWWPAQPSGWRPPAELVEFLDDGPPPVVIGFGSTVTSDAEAQRLSALVAQAVRSAGARAVVQTGWAGLDASGDDVIAVGDIPHDWLFARAADRLGQRGLCPHRRPVQGQHRHVDNVEHLGQQRQSADGRLTMTTALGPTCHHHVHARIDRATGRVNRGHLRRHGQAGVVRPAHPGPVLPETHTQQGGLGRQRDVEQIRPVLSDPVHQADSESLPLESRELGGQLLGRRRTAHADHAQSSGSRDRGSQPAACRTAHGCVDDGDIDAGGL